MPTALVRALPALMAALVLMMSLPAYGQIFLPGTQPKENGVEFADLRQCELCHSARKPEGYLDPHGAWETGMMAHAGQDPVFRAAVVIANQDIKDAGSYCWRCHTPRGWIAGRAKVVDGSMLEPEDLRGITCDVCHRMVDPLSEEAAKYAEVVPPGYGNAMLVLDNRFVVRGPYTEKAEAYGDEGLHPHDNVQSNFQSSSELCASCHDFSNPYLADDVLTQPPHSYGPVVRTYSEWAASAFAKEGPAGSCQGCHYPRVTGGSEASRYTSPHRDHFVRMGALGGATWTKEAVRYLYPREVDKYAIEEGVRRSQEYLRTAAELKLTFPSSGRARLRVTNKTGHKLPTGYPEGTRVWVNVRFLDANGKVLGEKGVYGEKTVRVLGKTETVSTLLNPSSTTVYEVWTGLSAAQAKRTGKRPGKSFNILLSDVVLKDNRIPPRGFTNRAFAARLAAPVGTFYEDYQNYDTLNWTLPAGTRRVEARLLYQSASWEYVSYLISQNKTNDEGEKLWDVYKNTGMCPPELVNEAAADVPR